MSRSSVRRLFVAAFVFLVVQYGLVGVIGLYASEPWPAVVLPAFKSVYSTSGTFEVTQTTIDVLHVDGTRSSYAPSTFLAAMPRSHHSAFLREQCRPASLSGTDATERCRTPDGTRWFVDRASALAPTPRVRGVDVVWSRLRFTPQSSQPSATPLDTLHLRP